MTKKVIIIGSGHASLIAASALLQRTDIVPVILQSSGSTFITHGMIDQQQSYIYYNNKLFPNPVQLSLDLLYKMGISASLRIITSYLASQLFPSRRQKTLEDVMINRYGKSVYKSFYKDYIEKLYGMACREIPATWGVAPMDYVAIDPSLSSQVTTVGGKIFPYHQTKEINMQEDKITSIIAINNLTEEVITVKGDYFISTMPVQDFVTSMNGQTPYEVKGVVAGLQYRNRVSIGILLKKLSFLSKATGEWKPLDLRNSVIYIADKDLKVGCIQLTIPLKDSIWINMEYYCAPADALWKLADEDFQQLAVSELEKNGFACATNVLDTTITRTEKVFTVYSGTYDQFSTIHSYLVRYKNLFFVDGTATPKDTNTGLTAMAAVNNILADMSEKGDTRVIEPITSMSPNESKTLKEYVFNTPANKWYLWMAILGVIVQFVVFKYFYPFAGFIDGDSYVYLETAYHNLDINTYPIGYSKFLRLFSVFTKYDTLLIAFQYSLLQVSLLSFIYTLFKFLKPAKWIKVSLFGFMIFNPVLLYLSNYVSSDVLFLSLSLIWFTLLLWMIYKPTNRLIILHGIVLLLAFTVRYNALWYPAISALAFLLSKQGLWVKVTGMAFGIILIGAFICFTSNKYYKLTGISQFTPFTGWQMANNAMYAYRYVDSSARKPVPSKFRELDNMIKTYFDTTRDVKKYPVEMLVASTMYMWDPRSPLQHYMNNQFKKDTTATSLKRWATVAPLYADYGGYLIRQYPFYFGEHYLWPNFLKYYVPPIEFLETYNMKVDSVQPIARVWFQYKNNKVHTHLKDFKVTVLNFYPIMAAVINVVFLFSMVFVLVLGIYKKVPLLKNVLLLAFGLWITNLGFSVFASPIALRFQLFPLFVSTAFAFLLIGNIWKVATTKE
ncbi:hypothetical protein [Chitinophaga sp. MM2321]|uniref:hypothetical protein n=1 Tax=Chitinophaga sp. MM2321 TaxID=3137178 RepID=UPI0032D59FEF